LTAGTCVVIAETSYIGRLGVESLAAMALVFPCVILTMTMSGGAMGGGVASAIARAIGAGDKERASTLAAHALLIGICFGLGFMPIPSFGMRGVAAGSLTAYLISISVMSWYLFSGRARVVPKIRGLRIQGAMFIDILKVVAIACLSPLQSVLTISIFTHLL